MKAEYVSLTEAAKEFIWLKNVIDNKSLNLELSENVMFCDHQAAISFSKSPVENYRTKHIDVRYHFLRNLIYDKLSEFWDLENLGIEARKIGIDDEENIDNDIMSEFEAGISYQNKRYKVKFPWKPNMKTLLENNEESARKRFLKLRSRFKNDSSLFEDYKLVEIWCLGLDWDDKLPKQLEVSWNKWCNEIHYLSEIKIPRYYFQNFLPLNATTIQLHCFSDASKRAYGTVAYLRIELNDGNIISSFVLSKKVG
ncbi:integrase catalytic domain-containing protein [Trichonephila clavipes]|nr:integrase catalytic domain-containing protein [Trichonephila clavipes]